MFNDQKICEQVLSTMKYDLKFNSFKIEGMQRCLYFQVNGKLLE
jgi:hypothetical protein